MAPSSGKFSPRTLPTANLSCTKTPLAVLAVLDNGSVFTPILDSNGDVLIKNEVIATRSAAPTDDDGNLINPYEPEGEVLEYSYTLTYKYNGAISYDYLVSEMYNWYDYYIDITDPILKLTALDKYHETAITSTIDTKIKHELIGMMWDDASTGDPANTSTTFVDTVDSNGTVTSTNKVTRTISGLYLYITTENVDDADYGMNFARAQAYLIVEKVRMMKKRHFIKLLTTKIDTDYKVEKKKWWEVVLFIVLIIISIVVAFFTSGLSAAFSWPALAAFAGGLALGFSISGLILSEVGGLSAQGMVKVLGAFATIIGYVAVLLGIYAAITAMAQAATEATLREAAAAAGENITSSVSQEAISAAAASKVAAMSATELINAAVTGAVEMVKSAFTSAAMGQVGQLANGVMQGVGLITQGYNYYLDQEAKEVEALQKEYDEYVDQQNEEILNRPYTNSPLVTSITIERLSSPDMLQEMSIKKDEPIGRDKSFSAWYSDVNI